MNSIIKNASLLEKLKQKDVNETYSIIDKMTLEEFSYIDAFKRNLIFHSLSIGKKNSLILGDPQAFYMLLKFIKKKEQEKNLVILKNLVNQNDINQNTPLILAVCNEWIDAVKILLSIGADVTIRDKNKFNAIHWAILKGNLDILQLLTNEKVHIQKEPDTILGYSYLEICILYQHQKIQLINYLISIKSYQGNQFIFFIIKTCKISLLKKITTQNIDVRNQEGDTPLMYACSFGGDLGYSMAKYLLEKKVNVNDINEKNGYNALMYALLSPNSSLTLILLLLAEGTDLMIKEKKYGSNVLMMSLKEKLGFRYLLGIATKELLYLKDNNGICVADLEQIHPEDTIRKMIENKLKSFQ